jgi:hypothetical protein
VDGTIATATGPSSLHLTAGCLAVRERIPAESCLLLDSGLEGGCLVALATCIGVQVQPHLGSAARRMQSRSAKKSCTLPGGDKLSSNGAEHVAPWRTQVATCHIPRPAAGMLLLWASDREVERLDLLGELDISKVANLCVGACTKVACMLAWSKASVVTFTVG